MENERTSMSDSQRRFVCRIAFLLLCLLPTLLAIYFVFHQPGPSDWQQLIQAELGIAVQIDSVETPTPSMTMFRGVRFGQSSQTGKTEMDMPGLSGRVIEQMAIIYAGDSSNVIVEDPIEIDSKELTKLVRNCGNRLRDSAADSKNWRVRFNKITLVDSDIANAATLSDVRLFVESSNGDSGSVLSATVLADIPFGEDYCTIQIDVRRSGNLNSVIVDTNDGYMPSHLLRCFSEFALSLGSHCQFNGRIETNYYDEFEDQPSGQLVGRLSNVQLDQLAEFTGRRLIGTCDIEQLDLAFVDGQINTAGFRVVSPNPITIARKILDDAEELGAIRFSNELLSQQMVKLASVGFNLRVENSRLFLSNPSGPRGPLDSVMMDGIATDNAGEAIVICNGQHPIEAENFATLVMGKETIDSHSFNLFKLLQGFKAPTRLAHYQDSPAHY